MRSEAVVRTAIGYIEEVTCVRRWSLIPLIFRVYEWRDSAKTHKEFKRISPGQRSRHRGPDFLSLAQRVQRIATRAGQEAQGTAKRKRATPLRSLTQTNEILDFKGTKTEEPRTITLPISAVAALAAHRNRQNEFREQFGPEYRSDLDLIFANPDGTPLKPDSISSSVSLLFRRLKLPKGKSLHSLRHAHGSHMLASGVPLPAEFRPSIARPC